MLIATRQYHQLHPEKLDLSLNSQEIEQVKEHKFLGVHVDDRLSWDFHIDNLRKKIAKNIYLLSQMKEITDMKSRKLFFNAHIRSHLDYASTIWDGSSEVNIKRINSLYRRAVKMVDTRPIPTDNKMTDLSILKLSDRFNFNKCVFMYKILNNMVPEYLTNHFQSQNIQSRTSRNRTIQLPLPRIDLFKTSLSFSGISLWNKLPLGIKQAPTLKNFKKTLVAFLPKQC